MLQGDADFVDRYYLVRLYTHYTVALVFFSGHLLGLLSAEISNSTNTKKLSPPRVTMALRAALISVSVAVGHTPAEAASPRPRGQCVA